MVKDSTTVVEEKNQSPFERKYIFQVNPQNVDFQFKITLSALTNIILTTSQMNADDKGLGLRTLNEMNCSWILLRLAIEMTRFPEQYENIQVETWVEEVGRVSTTRNFCIRDERNEIIGNASSNWAMFDMETRRAKDLHSLETIQELANNIEGLIEKPIRMNAVDGEEKDDFRIKYSHIDINGHVNSVCYVQWICDCFSLDRYRKSKIKRFEINFLKELLFDESVQVYQNEIKTDDYRFEIRSLEKVACRARIVF